MIEKVIVEMSHENHKTYLKGFQEIKTLREELEKIKKFQLWENIQAMILENEKLKVENSKLKNNLIFKLWQKLKKIRITKTGL